MKDSTGVQDIIVGGYKRRHRRALIIRTFGRSQRSQFKVARLKRVAVASVRRRPMAIVLDEKQV